MSGEIHKHTFDLLRKQREKMNGHRGHVFWITGLSGSGKSTVANGLANGLFQDEIHTYTLDGDNVRSGINKDLGFDLESRSENIRRIAEIARLMCDAGLAVICCFISPLEADRRKAASIIGVDDFSLVFVDCPVDVCAARDVKGLYEKAYKGEIENFTGVSSPYEPPADPDVHIRSDVEDPVNSIQKILTYAKKKISL